MKVKEIIENKNENINEGFLSTLGTGMGNILKIANLLGAGYIFGSYMWAKYKLQKQLESKQITKQQYDLEEKKHFDILVEKLVLILAASVFLKTFSGFSQLLRILPFGGVIASAIGLGTAAINSAVIVVVATGEGKKILVQVISEGLLNGMTDTFYALLEDFKQLISNTISLGKEYYQTGKLPEPKYEPKVGSPDYIPSAAEKANTDAGISNRSTFAPLDYSKIKI
jgi:hypothetical protein